MPKFPLLTRRILQLVAGLLAFGFGIGLMVRAEVGVSPWDVLGLGLVRVTGLSFGLITILIGAVVLVLWIPLKQKFGLGTVLNVLSIGPAAQLVLWVIPPFESIWLRVLVFAVGLALVALGTGMYIGTLFGPGPRDGLMTGLHEVTGLPIWVVRTGLEVTVLGIGWLLGGDVGFGTIAFALFIGPLAQPSMKWFDMRKAIAHTAGITDETGATRIPTNHRERPTIEEC